jgi:hypothetical protein
MSQLEFFSKPTTVVHFKKSPYDIYIGRGSIWGNPFTHLTTETKAQFVVSTREEAIEKYREWLMGQPELLKQIPNLRGKVLGCWCVPKRCHGDVLAELANSMMGEQDDK